jgi:hypothetical protein
MATFASVDAGYVVGMFEVADAVIDVDGVPVEALGQAFLTELYGPAEYLLTGTDGYRGCYPGIGYTWDGTIFAPPIQPQPEPEPTPDDYTVQPEPVIEAP